MPEIFQMDRVDRIADILYGVAVAEGLIGYGPLAKRVGLQANFLSQPLAQVSERAAERGDPIWSALVVGKDTRRPHEGFYTLARRLRSEYATLDDEVLWQKERERCYAAAR
ncbi:hypothetical protein [Micromonospora sp. NPDC023814]|jgi:hypothetical protein|uniref:hypothetical protein n=1 Tax=Micromonospora sp. NPDC023814 TaxID=3154596 RepID=UPI0033DC1931